MSCSFSTRVKLTLAYNEKMKLLDLERSAIVFSLVFTQSTWKQSDICDQGMHIFCICKVSDIQSLPKCLWVHQSRQAYYIPQEPWWKNETAVLGVRMVHLYWSTLLQRGKDLNCVIKDIQNKKKKMPSEMEVAPCYLLFTQFLLFTLFRMLTLLTWLNHDGLHFWHGLHCWLGFHCWHGLHFWHVYTVDKVYTVGMVYTVDMVFTVYTIQTTYTV